MTKKNYRNLYAFINSDQKKKYLVAEIEFFVITFNI